MLTIPTDTVLLEPGSDHDHPLLGTADEVLGILVAQVEEIILLETGKVDAALEIVGLTLLVSIANLLEEDAGSDVFVLLGRITDMGGEAGRA